MKRNDFLIVDPQGNIAVISKEDAKKLQGSTLEMLLKTSNQHTQRNINEAKKIVEKYLKFQWIS